MEENQHENDSYTRRREDVAECLGYHNVRTQHTHIPLF
jgi:hypothetical protein